MNIQEKRPDDITLLVVNYSERLDATDSIASSTWSLHADLQEDSKGQIGTHYTWILLSGGLASTFYDVSNVITSANNEQLRSVIPVFVKDESAIAIP